MPYALILFIAMPIIEIAVLLRIGDVVGWVSTLLVVIATAIIGSLLLRQQGLATLNRARNRMDAGELPAREMLEGVLIVVGGVLLLTPGFVTDAFGFLCVIPFSRRWLARRLSARAVVGFAGKAGNSGGAEGGTFGHQTGASQAGAGKVSPRQHTGRGDVIDGDFTRIDDD